VVGSLERIRWRADVLDEVGDGLIRWTVRMKSPALLGDGIAVPALGEDRPRGALTNLGTDLLDWLFARSDCPIELDNLCKRKPNSGIDDRSQSRLFACYTRGAAQLFDWMPRCHAPILPRAPGAS
jgi:hypothetical protein